MPATADHAERRQRDRQALPVELVSEIIALVAPEESKNPLPVAFRSNVEQEAFRTLANASLVSHSWNTICSRHIFRTVFISNTSASTRLSFLHFEASHLAEYIQRLYVWWNDDTRPASEWLAECFHRMKNFRELILVSSLAGMNRRILAAGVVPVFSACHLRKLTLRDWVFAEDAYDLLGLLSPTLEELALENIDTENIEVQVPPTTHLAALRRLVLVDTVHPMLSAEHIIECPRLEYLECRWLLDTDSWNMPPWVPAGLKEVVLGGSIMSALPNFGQTIRPSVVRISLFGSRPYINHFTWFKDCIGRLPFPNLIQVFEIRIYIGIPTPVNNFLPATSDYEMMSQSLQPLWRAGGVKNIAVNITVTFDGEPDVVPDLARESAKLKAGFARLLPANVSDMRFVVSEQLHFRMTRATAVDMCWSIQRV